MNILEVRVVQPMHKDLQNEKKKRYSYLMQAWRPVVRANSILLDAIIFALT